MQYLKKSQQDITKSTTKKYKYPMFSTGKLNAVRFEGNIKSYNHKTGAITTLNHEERKNHEG